MEILSRYTFGNMEAIYLWDPTSGQVELNLLPKRLSDRITVPKPHAIDSLAQVKLIGDDYPGGFSHGRTMRNSQSAALFQYQEQSVSEEAGRVVVSTKLRHERQSCTLEHLLVYREGYEALESQTIVENDGDSEVVLEMLSSFSLGGLTPLAKGDAASTLIAHRIRSKWSAEGQLESIPIEQLQLEPSWAKHGVQSERFGQVGSMPVRGYFPFAAVEDKANHTVWAAQLAHPGSWQMELYRRDDALCLSGGLADREFGHWLKSLRPGDRFESPIAYITVGEGGVDQVAQRLTQQHELALRSVPEAEETLPVLFNEYCTTWGMPTHENISRIASILRGKGIRYLVIDAGWYAEPGKAWWSNMGDWNVSEELFPQGLEHTIQAIRDNGMIPGIWFELENVGPLAESYGWEEHLLHRDGIPITSGQRRFWNFSDPFVTEYLAEKVIGMIKRYDFGYLKIDYNETIGIGCDGAESLGEGLRLQMEAVQRFLKRIRSDLPQLVIENCASGGHRLEPSMIGLTAMSSFSDAHEEPEIPIIAANMHRVILPRVSQIWAVLRKEDSDKRLRYSIAATFLGRMCLSGDVYDLSPPQWNTVEEGIRFYERIAPVIKEGLSHWYGPPIRSYRHPEGWQALVRISRDKKRAFAVVHTFGNQPADEIRIVLPTQGVYGLVNVFGDKDSNIQLHGNELIVRLKEDFSAIACYLTLETE